MVVGGAVVGWKMEAGGRMGVFKEIAAEPEMLKDELLKMIKQKIDESKVDFCCNGNNGYMIKIRSENGFILDIYRNEVIVVFYEEHQHFYLFDYETIEEFIIAIKDFTFSIYFNPIKFEYTYKSNKLMSYRVYKKNTFTHEWEKLSSTVINFSPLFMFGKKNIKTQIINFSQQ